MHERGRAQRLRAQRLRAQGLRARNFSDLGMRLLLLFALLFGPLAASAAGPGKLYVFYPSLARPLAIQDALSKQCPGLSITVFGRLTDFDARMQADPPDAVLSLPAVLKEYPGYVPKLQGLRKGLPAESYVLLSLGKPLDPERMDGVNLGVVGLLDRKPMAAFVGTLVPGTPRLDRVTKVEDLLPLLTFGSVSAVLVSESIAEEFRRKSRANLIPTPIGRAKVGLTALAIRKDAATGAIAPTATEITRAIQALRHSELDLLGVDAWK